MSVSALFNAPFVLTDGGLETRILYEFHRPLPNFAACALLDDEAGRAILRTVYQSYLDVALRHALPIQLGTPTWRAGPHWVDDVERVNAKAVAFLRDLVRGATVPVAIAGVIGPSCDGYTAADALDETAASDYHRRQATALADAGCDLLYAPTFPAIGELHGAARAMAQTGKPFVLAPMLHPDGTMIDGTPLGDAIERIDTDLTARPWHYMLGCIYPTHAQTALEALFRSAPDRAHRIVGIKANASPLSPEELDRLHDRAGAPAATFAADLWACAERFGLNVLGGCCGTDASRLEAVATLLPAGN